MWANWLFPYFCGSFLANLNFERELGLNFQNLTLYTLKK